MRPKNVITFCIILFVLSGLLVNSVFAMPTDPQKEIVMAESELETKRSLVREQADQPEFSTGSSFYKKFDRTSAYIDHFSPPVWADDDNASAVPVNNSYRSSVAVVSLLQESVQGSSPWQQLNQDGFGDNNFQIPAMQEFEGYLYAGTWKNVDEVISAEIWRTADSSNWEKVDERGHNGCADLVEYDGYLYCGSWDGAVWRSDDGITWQDVVTDGFGDPNNGIARFAVYNNLLYSGTWNGITGTQIWRTNDGTNWTKFGDGLDPSDIVVGAISTEIFDGYLYWGTGNWETGAQLWRTDGTTLTLMTEGTSPAISSLAAFDGYLYAGVWDDVSAQVWRSANGSDWTPMVSFSDLGSGIREANGLEVYDGMLYLVGANPDTGLEVWRTVNGTDWEQVGFVGFGDPSNGMSFWDNAITTFQGKLIISTNNYETGGEVWAYVPNVFEVYDVGIWMNLGVKDWIWGHAIPGSNVTINTPHDTIYSYADPACNGCFGINEPIEINPGETITVTAGSEIYPVDFTVPTPIVVNADSTTEQVTGQIGGWDTQTVVIHGSWENGDQEVTSDASGNFSATFSEIPRGGEGYIHFPTFADGADINYHQYFRTPDLVMEIYAFADQIEGQYAPGHDLVLTVNDSDDNLKAVATLTTGEIDWWGDRTGFATQIDDEYWVPSKPDILPGDKIYGSIDGGVYLAYSQVGEITGTVDTSTDSISGTINAPWLIPDPGIVDVECYAWGAPEGAPDKYDSVVPDGDPVQAYTCAWDPNTEWDVDLNQWIGVAYRDPQANKIIEGYYEPDYNLYLSVNYFTQGVIEGNYPPGYDVTLTITESDGTTVKGTTTITTTEIPWWGSGTGFSTELDGLVWDPERPDIQAWDWVFAEVDVDGTIYSAQVQAGGISGEVDTENDSITGTIDVPWLDPEVEIEIQCHPWGAPGPTDGKQDFVFPNGEDPYYCEWDPGTEWDIEPNQPVGVTYADPDGHWIFNGFFAISYDLYLHVNYYGDAIEGWYPPGYDVTLTVTESDGVTVKATTTMTTTEVPWWNGDTGFSTSMEGVVWDPERPDIQAGDWVFGEVDVEGTIYSAEIQLGDIFGEVDVDNDSITGTIDVPWLDPEVEIEIQCHPWGAPGPTDGKQDFVFPDGEDPYYCEWDPNTEWDIQPNQEVGVVYLDPNGHWIYNGFFAISYDLYLNVNYDHDWIELWYPPDYEGTLTVTESDGVTVKATVDFTTTVVPWWGGDTGFSTNMDGVVWTPERPDIQAGDWVFGEIEVNGTIYSAELQLGEILGEVDIDNDSITGTIDAPWLPQDIEVWVWCHPWGAPPNTDGKGDSVYPDGEDAYTCAWDPDTEWDIQPTQQIGVSYTGTDHHSVYNVFIGYTNELILNIQYDHDWIDGTYEAGHEIFLRVLDSFGVEKAHITLTSGYIDGWGSNTGFATHAEGATWLPNHPDIQPGDTIYGEVDGGTFTAEVIIGSVTADLDLDNDQVSGTLDAEWLPQTEEVKVSCEIWEPTAPQNKEDWVLPTGDDLYLCDWTDDGYDLNETSNLMVAYYEAAGHRLIGEFRYPAPRLRIEKWLEGGEPGEGGNVTFNIQYRNEGNANAVNAIITDTFVQGLTYISDTSGLPKTEVGNQVIWQLGNLAPDEWVNFYVFAHVEATEGNDVINTAVISSDGFDSGNPEDRTRTWQGTVIANNTHVNVGKGTWTWLPAPGQNYVYNINVCNNGPTGSTELTLTETLPGAVTLVSWWGREAGWSEVSYVDNILTLEYPSIPGGTCREVYVKVNLDPNAQPDQELINLVEIYADNDDPNEQDNESWLQHNVGSPFTDLSVSLGWHWGVLTPGGQYRFGIYFYNDGNVPVEGPMPLVLTLPPGVQFGGWSHWDWAGFIGEPVVDGNTVTWLVDDLDPGYYGSMEIIAMIDPGVEPGTELTQEVTFEVQAGESDIENNHAALSVTVQDHGPNLRIRKYGDWSGSDEGSQYAWYRLEFENIGDEPVENVEIRDDFPTEMIFTGNLNVGHNGGWSWDDGHLDEHYFIVYLDRLEPGWAGNIHFDTRIPWEIVQNGATYENIATIGPSEGDANPEDNAANRILAVGPDFFLFKSLWGGEYLPGETLTYRIDFGNWRLDGLLGRSSNGNGIVTDTLPEGMSYVPGTAQLLWFNQEWIPFEPTVDGQVLTWTFGPLDVDQNHVLLYDVVLADEISEGNSLINTAVVSTDDPATDVDPYMDNNTSSVIPDLDLVAPMITSEDHATFAHGEVGSFTITTTGFPTPMIWTDDGLPSWLTLIDQGDGTAILSGTPPDEGGVDYILFKAANGVTPNAEQSFTLTWEGRPDYPIFLPLILR